MSRDPSPTESERVLVIGGGIGGVAAGAALRQAGIDAVVFERAPDLRRIQVGGCYVLWYAGMLSLAHLGLEDAARDLGHTIERFELTDRASRVLTGVDVGRRGHRHGAQPLAIRRADLHRVLVGALPPDGLVTDARLSHFAEDAAGVTAVFADGREERGTLLAGADGIDSVVRSQLHGEAAAIHPGYAHWSGIARDSGVAPPALFRIMHGGGARFAFFRLNEEEVCWWVTRPVPEGAEGDHLGTPESLAACFGDWAAPARELLAATAPETIHRRDTLDRPVQRRWGRGRVTLIGDAAHAMTFNLGQGAGAALTSAVSLARHLRAHPDGQSAFRAYEAARLPVTAPLVVMSRRVGEAAAWTGRASTAHELVLRTSKPFVIKALELDVRGHRPPKPAVASPLAQAPAKLQRLTANPRPDKETGVSAEDNAKIVRHYLEEVWNNANVDVIDEVLAPDVLYHDLAARTDLPPGREGVKQVMHELNAAFSNMGTDILHVIAEGDHVAVHYRGHGVHTGHFQGMPPTNRSGDMFGMAIVRLEDGRIVEGWQVIDVITMLQGLGIMPAGGMPKPMAFLASGMVRLRDRLKGRDDRSTHGTTG